MSLSFYWGIGCLLLSIVEGGFLVNLTPEKNSQILNAPCGPIRGNIYKHKNGTKIVDGYLGIPFAKAPVGALKFKKPVAAEKWTEPRDCYEYGPGCPQTGRFAALTAKSTAAFAEENCLTLNVFAPRWKLAEFPKGLPVLVYIYGGGYEIGFTSYMDDYSLTGTLPLKDVIVVTMNYRLGPLGFLTIADGIANGNYGLWDQTLALQWVQDNIASFGGNPESVTLSGTSAGATSTDFLSLSPHSNQLFQRSISMSGTAFCNFAIRPKDVEVGVCKEFAQFQGYTGTDSQSLFDWYMAQNVSKFKEVAGFQSTAAGAVPFIPNFDGDFFPKPFDILRREAPKKDALITVVTMESVGMIIFNPLFANAYNNFEGFINETYGPDVTDYYADVKKKLTGFYLKDVNASDKATVNRRVVDYVSDSVFNSGTLDAVKSYVKYGNKVYLGSFNYFNDATKDMVELMQPFKEASHSSDFKYYFGSGVMANFTPTDEEMEVMDMSGTLMANFVKYGDPNGKSGTKPWKPYTILKPNMYYKIDYPTCEMSDNFQNGRLRIYDDINKNSKKYQQIVYGKVSKRVVINARAG